MKSLDICVKFGIHLYSIGVELKLGRIKKSLVGCKSGNNLVCRDNEVYDIHHSAIRHSCGDITCHCIGQGGLYVRLRELLGPGTLTVKNITETLYENMSCAKHIGKLTNLLSILDRLVKGSREIMRYEDSKVGVITLHILVGMSVYNRKIVVVVLLTYEAAGILAEGTNLVLEGSGMTDKLGFIKNVVYSLHDLISYLNSYTDINSAGLMRDIMLCAKFLEPVCATSTGCDYYGIGADNYVLVLILNDNAGTYLVFIDNDINALSVELDLNAVVKKMLLNSIINLLRLLGTKMSYGTVNELKACGNSIAADLLLLLGKSNTLYVRICAELEILLPGTFPHDTEFTGQVH